MDRTPLRDPARFTPRRLDVGDLAGAGGCSADPIGVSVTGDAHRGDAAVVHRAHRSGSIGLVGDAALEQADQDP